MAPTCDVRGLTWLNIAQRLPALALDLALPADCGPRAESGAGWWALGVPARLGSAALMLAEQLIGMPVRGWGPRGSADFVGEAVPGGLPGDAEGDSDPVPAPPASTGRGHPLGD
jgi:hypothetical protein